MKKTYSSVTYTVNTTCTNNSVSASYSTTVGTGWHHIVLVRYGGLIDMYYDNVKVITGATQSTATGTQNTLALSTGKAYGASSTQVLDEVGYWSRVIYPYHFGQSGQVGV